MKTMASWLLAGSLLGATAPSLADTAYPSRPLTMVVGFAPGGGADTIARVIAEGLGQELGQQIVVENRPGAESTVAAGVVARAKPDGYTFVFGTNSALVAVPTREPGLVPYDPFTSFTPVSAAGQFSTFLVINPELPVKTVPELLEHIRANPGVLTSGSSNSASELGVLQLVKLVDGDVQNVRYRGDIPALTDMVGGRIDMMLTTGTNAPPMVKDGRVRALMATQPERSASLPDVPTATELGINAVSILPWAGFFGPAGMDPAVTARLSEGLQRTLARPDVREKLALQGFEGYGMAPEAFGEFFKARYDDWVETIRKYDIRFE